MYAKTNNKMICKIIRLESISRGNCVYLYIFDNGVEDMSVNFDLQYLWNGESAHSCPYISMSCGAFHAKYFAALVLVLMK